MIGCGGMSMSRCVVLMSVLGLSLLAQGCTRQAWFESMKARERQECHKQMSDSEIQQCLERVNSTKIE